MSDDVQLKGLEVLTHSECATRLAGGCVGRVGFIVAGRPHVLPVNYAMDDEATVVFRTTGGSILTNVIGHAVVFEVDGLDEAKRTGWSVCVYGFGRELTAAQELNSRLQTMSLLSWATGRRDRWIAITGNELTGRRIPVTATAQDLGGWVPGLAT